MVFQYGSNIGEYVRIYMKCIGTKPKHDIGELLAAMGYMSHTILLFCFQFLGYHMIIVYNILCISNLKITFILERISILATYNDT